MVLLFSLQNYEKSRAKQRIALLFLILPYYAKQKQLHFLHFLHLIILNREAKEARWHRDKPSASSFPPSGGSCHQSGGSFLTSGGSKISCGGSCRQSGASKISYGASVGLNSLENWKVRSLRTRTFPPGRCRTPIWRGRSGCRKCRKCSGFFCWTG